MPEKEFKRMVLRKLSKTQENTDRQYSEIRKAIHNLYFNKMMEIMKKNQTKILELKNAVTERITVESLHNRLDQMEGITSELKDKSFEIIENWEWGGVGREREREKEPETYKNNIK
jgi:hypothetical protein